MDYPFDTLAAVEQLESVGIEKSQARAIVGLHAHGHDNLTPIKSDVAILKTDVAALKIDVATLKTDVATLKTDVAALKSDVAALKYGQWIILGMLTGLLGMMGWLVYLLVDLAAKVGGG